MYSPVAVKDSLPHLALSHLDLGCLLRHRLCDWLKRKGKQNVVTNKNTNIVEMDGDGNNKVKVGVQADAFINLLYKQKTLGRGLI